MIMTGIIIDFGTLPHTLRLVHSNIKNIILKSMVIVISCLFFEAFVWLNLSIFAAFFIIFSLYSVVYVVYTNLNYPYKMVLYLYILYYILCVLFTLLNSIELDIVYMGDRIPDGFTQGGSSGNGFNGNTPGPNSNPQYAGFDSDSDRRGHLSNRMDLNFMCNSTPVEPINTSVQPTNISVQPTNIPVQPTNISVQPTNTPVEPTNIPLQQSNIPVQPRVSVSYEELERPLSPESLKELGNRLLERKTDFLSDRLQQNITSKRVTLADLGLIENNPLQDVQLTRLKYTVPELFSKRPSNTNVGKVIDYCLY
jgi:hypothetical protein